MTKVVAIDTNTFTDDANDANDPNNVRRRATAIRTTIIVSPELDQNRHKAISLLHNNHYPHNHVINSDYDDPSDAHQTVYNNFSNILQQYRSQLVPEQQSAFDDAWKRLYTDTNNTINYELVSEPLLKEVKCVSEVY